MATLDDGLGDGGPGPGGRARMATAATIEGAKTVTDDFPADGAPPATPIPIDLAYTAAQIAIGYYGRAVISPDGSRVIYWVQRTAEESEPADGSYFLGRGAPCNTLSVTPHVLHLATGESTPLGPEGATSWRPWWSPDGSRIAFYCDGGGCAQVWVHDVATGADRRVSEARVKAKAFVGDEPYWSADGSEVLVPLYPGVADDPHTGDLAKASVSAATISKSDGPTVEVFRTGSESEGQRDENEPADPVRSHLVREACGVAAIDVADGSVRMIVDPGTEPYPSVLQRSPSGRWVSYLSVFLPQPSGSMTANLAVVPARGGKVKVVAEALPLVTWRDYYLDSYIWHPTRDRLLWVADGELWTSACGRTAGEQERVGGKLGSFTSRPLTVTADGKAAIAGIDPIKHRDLAEPRPQAIAVIPFADSNSTVIRLPEGVVFVDVVEQARNRAWSPGNAKTVTIVGERAATASRMLMRADLATGELSILWEAEAAVRFFGCAGDTSTIIGVYEDFGTPSDIYRFDSNGERVERLTNVEPRLAGVRFGSAPRVITKVPQPDGSLTEVTSLVLLPHGAEAGDRLPCLLFFYPGSSARGTSSFGGGRPSVVPVSVFLSRGYAVMLADAPIGPRGPQGSHPLEDLIDVVVPQVYRAAELGYIDIARVAIAGQSYGGYGTVATISGTNLFRAAIAIDGKYDLLGSYTQRWSETGQGRMGTHPWDNIQRYIVNSPYARVDRIHTPLLLIHGEDDNACPVVEAHKMFAALKRLGRPAQLAVYKGCGHVLSSWGLANAVDATERMVEFLDRHLAVEAET